MVLLPHVCVGGAVTELRERNNINRRVDRYRGDTGELGLYAGFVVVKEPPNTEDFLGILYVGNFGVGKAGGKGNGSVSCLLLSLSMVIAASTKLQL